MSLFNWLRGRSTVNGRSKGHDRKNHVRLEVEALEDRLVPANLDMTQVAMLANAAHTQPTHLYLNFDGFSNNIGAYAAGYLAPYASPSQIDADIQDIIYRTSEMFAPFNVEVSRLFGRDNYDRGNDGNTTVFVGPDFNHVNSLGKYPSADTNIDSTDYPGSYYPSDHVPDSDSHDVAFVDPFGNGGTLAWNPQTTAQKIAHEAGHTFGLAHVRTDRTPVGIYAGDPAPLGAGTVPDVMSYTDSNQYFADQTFNVTNYNFDSKTGQTVPTPSHDPRWATSKLWTPFGDIRLSSDPITTQNSFTYLQYVLGPGPAGAHVADTQGTTVDPILQSRFMPDSTIGTDAPVFGTIDREGDYQVYKLIATRTQTTHIYVGATGGDLNAELIVHDANGNLVSFTDGSQAQSGGRIEADLDLQAGATYYFIVGGHDGHTTGNFTLNLGNFYSALNPATGELVVHGPQDHSAVITLSATNMRTQLVRVEIDVGTFSYTNSYRRVDVRSITVDTGTELTWINIPSAWANKPITVRGSGSLIVNLPFAAGVSSPLTVDCFKGYASLIVDDSASTTDHPNITLQDVNGGEFGRLTGLTPKPITYRNSTTILTVKSGTGINTFNVLATPPNTVNLIGSSGTMSFSPTTTVNVGNAFQPANVRGTLSITNTVASTSLNIDSSADTAARHAEMGVAPFLPDYTQITGLFDGRILFETAHVKLLNIQTGTGSTLHDNFRAALVKLPSIVAGGWNNIQISSRLIYGRYPLP